MIDWNSLTNPLLGIARSKDLVTWEAPAASTAKKADGTP